MRAITPALRVPGPKPGTGAWMASSGRPNFSPSDQDEGNDSEAAASRQTASPRRIRIRSSATSRAARRRGGRLVSSVAMGCATLATAMPPSVRQ